MTMDDRDDGPFSHQAKAAFHDAQAGPLMRALEHAHAFARGAQEAVNLARAGVLSREASDALFGMLVSNAELLVDNINLVSDWVEDQLALSLEEASKHPDEDGHQARA
jgi:hypothetical protein